MSVINSANVQVGQSVTPTNNITLNTDSNGNLIINKGVYPTLTKIGQINNDGSSQVVSVTDFGADKTGATDSSAAISTALNSGAAVVVIPPGIYKMTASAIVSNSALKRIEGHGATLRADTSGVVNFYMIDAGTNNIPLSVVGLVFDSLTPNTTQVENWYGGTFSYDYQNYCSGLYVPDGSVVDSCTFKQLRDGLYINGDGSFSYNNPTRVVNNRFERNFQTSICYLCNVVEYSNNTAYLGSEVTFPSSRNVTIANNNMFLPGTPAIDVGGSAAAEGGTCLISNNISYGRDSIVVELGFKDVSVVNNLCYVTANTPDGVGIGITTNTLGQQIYRLHIADNQIMRYLDEAGGSNVMAYGMRIAADIDKALVDVSIHDNRMRAVRNGILVNGFSAGTPATNVMIRGNTIRGVTLDGILVINSAGIDVIDNKIVGSGRSGIVITTCATARINGNETETFTQHYDFNGTLSAVQINDPIHNAGNETALWKFTGVSGQLTCRGIVMPTNATPAIGQWAAGSSIIFPTPTVNGVAGAVCTTTGTPGTWYEFAPSYREGTWTPTVTASAGAITSYTASGRYAKIGRVVTLSFEIHITNNGTGATGLSITGMPFNASGAYLESGSFVERAAVGFLGHVAFSSTSTLFLAKYDNTYPGGTGHRITGTIVYQV